MPRMIVATVVTCAFVQGCASKQAPPPPAAPAAVIAYVPYGSSEVPSGYTSSGKIAFTFENSGLFQNIDPVAALENRPEKPAKPDALRRDLSDEDLALLGEIDAELGIADINTDPDVKKILASSASDESTNDVDPDPSIDALLNDPLLDVTY